MSITNFPHANQIYRRAIVSGELLKRCNSGTILGNAISRVYEDIYRFILEKYVNVSGDSTTGDAVISIDCFVFSHKELETLLLNAREEGRQDEQAWGS
jgi:hypothetical protein